MAVPFLDVISGITDISGQLLELYKIRRDGSFFEQQEFCSKLREYEAAAADERAAKREKLLAQLGEERAQADHERDATAQLLAAHIQVVLQRELKRDARLLENAPYDYDQDHLANIVEQATQNAVKPALLIAPFFSDELSITEADNGPPTFSVGIRRSWMTCPWSSDVAMLGGLLTRPLRKTDLDVLIIREALHALPVILVHGEIQGRNRVWCSITAWNMAPPYSGQAININLPPLPFPEANMHNRQRRIEFEDGLGWAVAVTAGLLAEWFHLTKTGRSPTLHRQLAKEAISMREVGPSLAAAYDVAIESGIVDPISGRANQAILLSESGYQEFALKILKTVAKDLQSGTRISSSDAIDILHRITDTAEALGDSTVAGSLRASLELESRRFLMGFLNLPESILC
jgi:hypothetical protein